VYQPRGRAGPHLAVRDGERLPARVDAGGGRPAKVWLAYLEFQGMDALRADLAAQGYGRRAHTEYPDLLYLDCIRSPWRAHPDCPICGGPAGLLIRRKLRSTEKR